MKKPQVEVKEYNIAKVKSAMADFLSGAMNSGDFKAKEIADMEKEYAKITEKLPEADTINRTELLAIFTEVIGADAEFILDDILDYGY